MYRDTDVWYIQESLYAIGTVAPEKRSGYYPRKRRNRTLTRDHWKDFPCFFFILC
jgi:hypothetical protein